MLLSPSSAWARIPSCSAPFPDWEVVVVEGPGQNLIVEFQKWKFVVQSNPQRLLCLGTRWAQGVSEGSSPGPSCPPPHQ